MLTKTERVLVEMIRKADRIKITATCPDGTEVYITPPQELYNTKKLCHDIALAIQDFMNNTPKLRKW